ncbi:TetR/AcrR family transcriptional regulator [Spirillospora albida]|uniref:TetR/AcrR family transcriptional regulator n=1 Tax=Spirillospora albida TaxID=58123 RepID=UPI00068CCDB4|nr:TetR/AcrR family transcriptional regulator [Spirillospora albida]
MAPRIDDDEATEQPRVPLSRRRVLRAAVEIADRDGLGRLTMRGLAQELGVEAMSLYHHVANKGAVVEGVLEVVLGEILRAAEEVEAPDPADDWRAALRARVLAAREVLLRHRWAPRALEASTTTSPAVIAYYDGVVGILRAGGFSYDLAHHALHALGSRAIGFSQELFEPGGEEGPAEAPDAAAMAERFPNLAGMVGAIAHDDPDGTLGFCDDRFEFEFGLDLILDGLERRRIGS